MINILYRDKYIVVCQKPAGLLSEGEGADCFPTLLAEALRARGEADAVYPVHRLDRETEGLMVYARTSDAAATLSRVIADGSMKKEYLAVVTGIPAEKRGTLRDLLFYDRRRGKSFVVDRQRKGVKEALLDYELLASREGYSLLRVALHTGRTHQIRVQLASRGLPLCGDRRYGAPPSPFSMGLCSTRLSFPHPRDGSILTFTYLPSAEESGARTSPFSMFKKGIEELR